MNRRNTWLFWVVVAASLADALSTLFGFTQGLEEQNRVIVSVGSEIGMIPALLGVKVTSLVLIYVLSHVAVSLAKADNWPWPFDLQVWTSRGISVVYITIALGYIIIAVKNVLLTL